MICARADPMDPHRTMTAAPRALMACRQGRNKIEVSRASRLHMVRRRGALGFALRLARDRKLSSRVSMLAPPIQVACDHRDKDSGSLQQVSVPPALRNGVPRQLRAFELWMLRLVGQSVVAGEPDCQRKRQGGQQKFQKKIALCRAGALAKWRRR
jgi:hypothetical protein